MRIAAAAMLCCVLAPAPLHAQSTTIALPTNDAVVHIGWNGSDVKFRQYDRWRGGVLASVAGGHYWTDHLKTEIEGAWISFGTHAIFDDIEHLGASTYATSDQRIRDVRVGVTQIYQFGRNNWVHPFAGAGIDIVHRDVRTSRPAQTRTVHVAPSLTVPVVIPALDEHRSDLFAEAVIRTGLKMYATESAFFSTEVKFGLQSDLDQVLWRLGFGLDF